MKKSENILSTTIELPKDFKYTLERAMDNEWQVALKKWQINLGVEERKRIMEYAHQQVEHKIQLLTKNNWSFEDKQLVININSMGRGCSSIMLDAEGIHHTANENFNPNVSILRCNEEWQVNQEPSSDVIPLNKFREHLLTQIKTWCRTAVFYGVGSYAQ